MKKNDNNNNNNKGNTALNDLDEMKSAYKDLLDNNKEKERSLLVSLYARFTVRFEKISKSEQFKELQKKIATFKDKERIKEECNKLNQISEEFKHIREESWKEFCKIYDIIIHITLDYEAKKKYKDSKKIYKKISMDLLEKQIQTNIKYEKRIILLKDDLDKLTVFFNNIN